MSILDLFRAKKISDLDEAVLVQLRKAGSSLSKPHNVEFYLYFPSESAAEEAASAIRAEGFEVKVEKAEQRDNWLCFATRTIVPELANLQSIRRKFVALAASLSGEYDGWGTGVVK